jgi:hypothetical protein
MSTYRRYLALCAFVFTAWGSTLLAKVIFDITDWYSQPSYEVILKMAPPWAWGILILLIGLGFLHQFVISKGMIVKNKQMNILSGLAAGVNTMWTVAFIITLVLGLNSPIGPLLFIFCAGMHMIAARLPMRDQLMPQELKDFITEMSE